jgi:N-acyl-D-amino-acid deacylase
MTWLLVLALAADFDILVRKARVVDGTGRAAFTADVGVRGERVAAVGDLSAMTAARVIDAGGRVLAPGFLDVHTHAEGGIEANPRADNFLLDGVTTIVTGNCGGSVTDVGAWLAKISKAGLGINVATLFGHNTVRTQVMGSSSKAASPAQMARMSALVDRAMREGAVGISTGLEYVPGTFVAPQEIVALARVAARHDGIYVTHMRDEGEKVLDALDESLDVGRQAKIRVQVSHLKQDTKTRWGMSREMLALLESARRQGVEVFADQYPYTRSSTGLTIRLPNWALEGGLAALRERLKAPAARERIQQEMLAMLRKRGYAGYAYAMVASTATKAWEGKTISQINVSMGRPATAESEAETILEILEHDSPSMVYEVMSEDDVERIMKDPFVAVASDGGVRQFGQGHPHPRSYGTNARVLAEYVRGRGVLTLEEAIRKMTSLPASIFRLKDRGAIRSGAVADLVLFDPAKVKDRSAFAEPHQYSVGFDLVLVSGRVAVDGGRITNVRAGKAVRRGT